MNLTTAAIILSWYSIQLTVAYKPVVIVHGILSQNTTMIKLGETIEKYHPGTRIYVLSKYCGWKSLLPLMHQAHEAGAEILLASALHPEGIHVIAQMIHSLFPHLVKSDAYKLFYTRIGQHLSVGNFWNDPHHQSEYYKYNLFLPLFNNEVEHPNNASFKDGLLKLKKMVLIGGPDDGVIAPWQSSQFGFYDENENVTNIRDRKLYKNDLIGLKTLDESGNLHLHTVAGVGHHSWYKNMTVIANYILPYLT